MSKTQTKKKSQKRRQRPAPKIVEGEEPDPEDIVDPANPEEETEEELQQRFNDGIAAVQNAMNAYGLALRAGFDVPKPVGNDGSEVQLKAVYQFVALRRPPKD